MAKSLPKPRTMYYVEKFVPGECPKCRHRFISNKDDYDILFGDIVDGEKIPRNTPGYDIIVCKKCGNHTARVLIETRTLSSLRAARKLIAEGFANLSEARVLGNATALRRNVYVQLPETKLIRIPAK